MTRLRLLRNIALVVLVATGAVVLACNLWVVRSSAARVACDARQVPALETALVLGTSPYTWDGDPSVDFNGRIAAAAELYRLGKVRRLIASGTNPEPGYNEPRKMQQALLDSAVPEAAITLDLYGDNTWESVRRAETEFGLRRYTIVTQKYHAQRAVFMAQQRGHDVVGYCAPGRTLPVREVFARVKAVLDALLLHASTR